MQGYSYYDIVIVLCDMFMISWDIIMAPRICMSIILNLKIVFDYQCHPGLLQGSMISMFERVANRRWYLYLYYEYMNSIRGCCLWFLYFYSLN